MNDVTVLTPLPRDETAVLMTGGARADDGNELVPRALFERLVSEEWCEKLRDGTCIPELVLKLQPEDYAGLHLVALRFDVCDRKRPGACPPGADGSLRAVFQPSLQVGVFADAALHAIYTLPSGQLPSLVAELRRLARIQAEPLGSPLKASPALSVADKPAYADGWRALVREHALRERLVRLTFSVEILSSSAKWLMRGVERGADGEFHPLSIPGTSATTLRVRNSTPGGFEVDPPNDTPPGLSSLLSPSAFADAGARSQSELLELVRAIDDPGRHSADTLPCVTCHVATEVFERRAGSLGIDAGSAPFAFDGGAYNLSLEASRRKDTLWSIRALGYWLDKPVISQRVVNETAQVLSEIEQRFR
jgi:hypothetical protein